MGERKPVIKHSQDSRCYLNISTTMPRSALPLCCAALASRHESQSNIWFSVLERTLSVWYTMRVWSVSIWTRRLMTASASLLPPTIPPLILQWLHNTFWQSLFLLAQRMHCRYIDTNILLNCEEEKKKLHPILTSKWTLDAKSIKNADRDTYSLYWKSIQLTYGLKILWQSAYNLHISINRLVRPPWM